MLCPTTALLLASLAISPASSHGPTAVDASNEENRLLSDFLIGLFDGGENDEGTSIVNKIFDTFGDDEDDSNPTVALTSSTTEIPTSSPKTAMPTSSPVIVIPNSVPITANPDLISTAPPTASVPTTVSVLPLPEPFICTGDSLVCPDGSFVSRDPRNGCSFQECPTLPSTLTTTPSGNSEGEVISVSWIWLGPMILIIVLGIWLWSFRKSTSPSFGASLSRDITQKVVFDEEVVSDALNNVTNAKVDWEVITGFRAILGCYAMFMHIGSDESWGHLSNLRGWPWHNHCFFVLGGFSLASPMNPVIKKKFIFFLLEIGSMYPMYIIALILGLANLLVVCRPSTFDHNFHWDSQPDDDTRGFFCEGTPAFKSSYWGSLILTITTHVFGLAAMTPIWAMHWWMGYSLWFSSIYYLCLAIFPAMYNYLFINTRKNLPLLLKFMLGIQVLNVSILTSGWFTFRHGLSYNHYDKYTGEKNEPFEYNNAHGSNPAVSNQVILSFYLFAPFWMIYFVIGGILAFIYDAFKPAERHNGFIWGSVADACTIVQIALSLVVIRQPMAKDSDAERWFRPDEADYIGDSGAVSRLWDEICARIMAPLTTLWIFALSTGEGRTASILRSDFLVKTLGPNGFHSYLFHQFIVQWYMAATRHGQFWNWWQFRKTFYWFSPQPCPVEWYEYFYLILIVDKFSSVIEKSVLPIAKDVTNRLIGCFLIDESEEAEIGECKSPGVHAYPFRHSFQADVAKRICTDIEKMTGIEPEIDSTMARSTCLRWHPRDSWDDQLLFFYKG